MINNVAHTHALLSNQSWFVLFPVKIISTSDCTSKFIYFTIHRFDTIRNFLKKTFEDGWMWRKTSNITY